MYEKAVQWAAFSHFVIRLGIHSANHLWHSRVRRPQETQSRGIMSIQRKQAGWGGVAYFIAIVSAGLYFTFASVQGDHGLFRRIQIEAEVETLTAERDALDAQIAELQNKTLRLSDDYLDLDLLDEQARSVLGMVRADEVVLR